jgi:hypothetical protein
VIEKGMGIGGSTGKGHREGRRNCRLFIYYFKGWLNSEHSLTREVFRITLTNTHTQVHSLAFY